MKTQFKNLAVRSGIYIITAISLAACGNTDKNKENKVESGNTPTEEVATTEAPAPAASDISAYTSERRNGNLLPANALLNGLHISDRLHSLDGLY